MKHKISILLLLSFAGSSECSQTYGAAASNKGHNQNRRSSSQEAVTMPSDYREIPAATGPVLKFGTDEPDTTLTWKKTKKYSGEKTYPSWDFTSKSVADDHVARKVVDSHTAYAKEAQPNKLTLPATLTLKLNHTKTIQNIIHDACQRRKPVIDQIPAMAGVITAAQQEKIRCSKLPDTIPYKSSYIRTAVKQVEDTNIFPVQPKEKEGEGSRTLSFQEKMLDITNNASLDAKAKNRQVEALLIDQARQELQKVLPTAMHLSELSSVFSKIGFGGLTLGSDKEKQILTNIKNLKDGRMKIVDAEIWQLLTTVHHPDAPGNLPNSTQTQHSIYRDRTPIEFQHEAILYTMLNLQRLRDIQLAFEASGDTKALQLALLTPEKSRCEKMITTIKAMITASEELRTKSTSTLTPKACVICVRYEDTHNLQTLLAAYKKRMEKVETEENAIIGIQTSTSDNAKLTTRTESSQPTSQADSTTAS